MTHPAAGLPAVLPGPGSPAFLPERIVAAHHGPPPRYADAVWSLAALEGNPSSNPVRIFWNTYPAPLREQFRLLAWSLINRELPGHFIAARSAAWRTRVSSTAIYQTHLTWRHLARWLHAHGACGLAACTPQVFTDFINRSDQPRSRVEVQHQLTALTRLWALDTWCSPQPVGVSEPPFSRTVEDFLPPHPAGGENAIEPLAPATMGPLLIWALRTVEDFADDILTAHTARQTITAQAARTRATPAGRTAVRAYLAELVAQQRPLPATLALGRPALAQAYIAARTGAAPHQVQRVMREESERLRPYLHAHPGPCPMDIPITGTVEGRPWTEAIDFYDATKLWRHLGTAAFIVANYLTGMRPSETLTLRRGACQISETGPPLLHAHTYKTAKAPDGTRLGSGQLRETPWVAVGPVVTAVSVLERMTGARPLLFDLDKHDPGGRHHRSGALSPEALRDRIEAFCLWANALADKLGRPGERIPEDPHGPIGTARFRRTLAWHIAHRPGGLVALALQYGHLRTAVSAGYASRSRDGIHDLLDIETARATADTLTRLHEDLENGDGVSGPAARRALHAAAQAPVFVGTLHTTRQAREVLANPQLAVHENQHSYLMCIYDPDKALCHRLGPRPQAPTLERCQPGCANIVRTDHHATRLTHEADRLEQHAASPLTPPPLAQRLTTRAVRLRDLAAAHYDNRIAQEESTP
ncbi:integrase [Streptomyces sp. WAC 04229]|uniref:integrase n=1 Tax=Streptomyces sp. WAC 04229 TaxID=2203206 RepID=UPI000F7367BA|nr:integrase [Streptomyces sp. WAC 04229]RSN53992.1 integrase [Streptomyces sp. WAC 04229]